MARIVIDKGDEDCYHKWRCTFNDNGRIRYWYCIKCRRVEEEK